MLLSVLGMSWFWFYGALVLVQLPLYCHNVLHGDESLVTITIVAFSVGVGVGSLLCERLSGRQVEIGLVPFGSIGLTVFRRRLGPRVARVDPNALLEFARVARVARGRAHLVRYCRDRRLRRLFRRAFERASAAAIATSEHWRE